MEVLLDFEECLQDSPVFRLAVDQFESDAAVLELQINKVQKCCSTMVEAGQVYITANQLFVSSLAELSGLHKKEDAIAHCLRQFNQGLNEMVNFHTILLDQTQRAINQQLTSLINQFFPPLGEIRREFVRIGEDLETAALKNAQVSRHKEPDAERAGHLLIATRKCYQHFALDYCLQLNNFKIQQKVDILNSVFSHFHAQYTFFHQGFDLLKDLEPTMKTMATQLAQLSADCTVKRKDLEKHHLLVQQRMAGPIAAECFRDLWNPLVKEEIVTDEDKHGDIQMEVLSLHANPQCVEQDQFEQKDTPPQARNLISENPNKQLNIAPDEVEDMKDGCLPEQTEENSGADRVLKLSEENSGDEYVPEQTEKNSGDEYVPEQTEENSGADRVLKLSEGNSGDQGDPEQSEEDSGDEYVPEQTEENSGDDSDTEQSEEDSGDEFVPEQTEENSGDDCIPEQTMENGGRKDCRRSTRASKQKALDEPGRSTVAMDTKKNPKKPGAGGEGPNTNQVDVESEDENVVSVNSVSVKINGRRKSKLQYCLFCMKPVSKMSRHLKLTHRHLPEVVDALGFPKCSKERRKRLNFLRSQGNFKHNTAVLKSGKGELIPCRRPSRASKPEDFKHCEYCKGLFHKNRFWHHSDSCTLKPTSITTGPRNIESNVPPHVTRHVWRIVNAMPVDDITAAIREDRVIIHVGEQLLVKGRNSLNRSQEAIEKMRELGGLLTIAKKVSSFGNMEDFINAQKYMELVDCVKATCEYNSVTGLYGKRALIDKLEKDLVMISRMLKAKALAANDMDSVDKARSFEDVHKERWRDLVPSAATIPTVGTFTEDVQDVHKERWRDLVPSAATIPTVGTFTEDVQDVHKERWRVLVPSAATIPTVGSFTEDVQRLHLFLGEKHDEGMCELLREPSPESWAALVKVCLTQVFLFNLQHQHAVSTLTVSDFLSSEATCWSPDPSLTEVQKILSRNFAKIVVKKSDASPASVLLTPKMLCTLNSMVEKRGECGVVKENQYLFAQPSELSHYHGSECLIDFAKVCGTRTPTVLLNTELRSHTALLSTVLNLCTTDTGLLAELLGHDLATPPGHYCLPLKTRQLARIAEVLLAREVGATGQFQGKRLDTIKVNLREEVLVGRMRRRLAYGVTDSRRRKWTQEEVKAVERHMMALITSGRVPGCRDCYKCLLAEPTALAHRDWKGVKCYVYNRISALKRHGMTSSK